MRQLAPLSPAIHLGARRVVVIGTGHQDDTHPENRHHDAGYPTLAQIGGHALSNIFLDSLSMDIERLDRINALLAKLAPDALQSESLRPVHSLVITPSSYSGRSRRVSRSISAVLPEPTGPAIPILMYDLSSMVFSLMFDGMAAGL